jgi:hypothetical protein
MLAGQMFGPLSQIPSLVPNDLRKSLSDAQKAGQSLAEFFGSQLHEILWLEALKLCTVGNLDALFPSPTWQAVYPNLCGNSPGEGLEVSVTV